MFTGIISGIGKVVKYDGNRLWISTPYRRIQRGESISIDGVCLTVAGQKGATLGFDVGRETQRITTLNHATMHPRVNLERALRIGDRLGGHWVSGHVEDVGQILSIEKGKTSSMVWLSVPKSIRRFMVAKGSLAVDGISLTVAEAKKDRVGIMIIPHTLKHTTLGSKNVGDVVNLEADLLAKYALHK